MSQGIVLVCFLAFCAFCAVLVWRSNRLGARDDERNRAAMQSHEQVTTPRQRRIVVTKLAEGNFEAYINEELLGAIIESEPQWKLIGTKAHGASHEEAANKVTRINQKILPTGSWIPMPIVRRTDPTLEGR